MLNTTGNALSNMKSFRIVSISPNTGSTKRLIFAANAQGELWKLFIRGDHPLFRDGVLKYRTEVRVPVVADVPNWNVMPFCEVEGPVQVTVDDHIKRLWQGDASGLVTHITTLAEHNNEPTEPNGNENP